MMCSGSYTYHALHADTADYAYATAGGGSGWTDAGTDVHLSSSNDSVGVGTDNPQAKLHVSTPGTEARLGQSTYGVYGQHFLTSSYGYLGGNSVGGYGYHGDNYGLWGGTYNGKGIYGSTSNNFGIGVMGENINGNYGYLGAKDYAVLGNASSGYAGWFTGKVYVSDKLGLGQLNPLNRLEVSGGAVIGSSYSGSETAPSDGLLVEGDVGIGLTNPNRKLYIAESSNELSYVLKLDNYNSTWYNRVGMLFSVGGDGGNNLEASRGKGALVYEYTNTWNRGRFHFLQRNTADAANPELSDAVMTITHDGKVGVGTQVPSSLFEIKGNNPYLIANTTANETGLKIKQNDAVQWTMAWNSGSGYLYFYDHTTKDDSKAGTRMVLEDGTGNVEIGTATPDAKLEVAGDLVVTGAVRGNIGPNDGAPFPRPAYDSGWWDILPGQEITFTHNIGGDFNKYYVDLQFNCGGTMGITNHHMGGYNYRNPDNALRYHGAYWYGLTATTIKVERQDDDVWVNQIRVRIWMYN
jgi:hypothetical protein